MPSKPPNDKAKRAAKKAKQGSKSESNKWVAAAAVGAAAVLVAALLLSGGQPAGLDDRAARSAAEDLLVGVSERSGALRQRGTFFGAGFGALLGDALRAEGLLLGMARIDRELADQAHKMVAHIAMAAGDLQACFSAHTRMALRTYDAAAEWSRPHEHQADGRFSFPFTQRARLRHDVAQLDHLLALDEAGEAGLPARALMAQARAGYSAVLEELGPTPTDGSNEGGTPAVRRPRSTRRGLRELTQVN